MLVTHYHDDTRMTTNEAFEEMLFQYKVRQLNCSHKDADFSVPAVDLAHILSTLRLPHDFNPDTNLEALLLITNKVYLSIAQQNIELHLKNSKAPDLDLDSLVN